MAAREIKKLNKGNANLAEPNHYDYSVMKPFVKFGIGAMSVIGHALIGIVKNIPKIHHDDNVKPGKGKIIKIS